MSLQEKSPVDSSLVKYSKKTYLLKVLSKLRFHIVLQITLGLNSTSTTGDGVRLRNTGWGGGSLTVGRSVAACLLGVSVGCLCCSVRGLVHC